MRPTPLSIEEIFRIITSRPTLYFLLIMFGCVQSMTRQQWHTCVLHSKQKIYFSTISLIDGCLAMPCAVTRCFLISWPSLRLEQSLPYSWHCWQTCWHVG